MTCKIWTYVNASLHQIRNWFQNRRMKLKRTVQDSLAHACQAKVASHMMHYSDLHSFRAAPYPSFYAGVQESATPYGSGFHYGPAAASGGLPSLPVDALYQYSQIQSLPVHPSNPSMMTPYPPYHSHYYSTQWEERPPANPPFLPVTVSQGFVYIFAFVNTGWSAITNVIFFCLFWRII